MIQKNSEPLDVVEYVNALPDDRAEAIIKLREICNKNINGAQECISYGMIGYVVPFDTYPSGYHCNTSLPLPFISIASQKNFIALYHMGIYADTILMDWFVNEFPKHTKAKLDMGKSCIRFKKMADIPYQLIEQLMQKMSIEKWISLYEKLYKK